MPSSHTSTATNSEIENLKDLLENEEIRYVRKGYGLISASLMTIGFFFYLPDVLFPLYSQLPHQNMMIMYAGMLFLLHSVCMILSNLMMYIIYKSKLACFERYRISSAPWPWEEDPQGFSIQLRKTFLTLIVNNFLIMPVSACVSVLSGTVQYDTSLDSFPKPLEIIAQIVIFMLCEDFIFYWTHRLFHTPTLYKLFHKKHHEYKSTIGLAAEYSHPIDFLISSLLPSTLGPTLLGSKCHIFTAYLWVIVRILETTDGHCGYEFSWSPYRLLPLSGSSNYHYFHHSHNVGNYGSFFTFWDTICKTNKHYWRYLAKQEKFA